jgi:hypothetical protein
MSSRQRSWQRDQHANPRQEPEAGCIGGLLLVVRYEDLKPADRDRPFYAIATVDCSGPLRWM